MSTPLPERCALLPVPFATDPKGGASKSLTKELGTGTRAPKAHLYSGEYYREECLLRVLSDDIVRPTTLEGTETRIRVSHKLLIDIRYRKDGEEHILPLQKMVCIATVRPLP